MINTKQILSRCFGYLDDSSPCLGFYCMMLISIPLGVGINRSKRWYLTLQQLPFVICISLVILLL
ncbi:hypothetical protein BDA99DRAFT_509523 [Phascolomyces articulosus]|uniref:Uncharacterized protein n=1 Tax=Phascolomyces articulosus TaxID=60185 RepID=A0AAD5K0G2_9FUNG|nr:hypothetical protein BDA99DRAFT_509523 [Phascolomyces articulosus]